MTSPFANPPFAIRSRSALVLVALVLGLASHAFAQTKPSTKLTMRLDWKPGGQYSPFYYGKEKGYYTGEGVDLTIVPGSGSSDSVKQVGSRAITPFAGASTALRRTLR